MVLGDRRKRLAQLPSRRVSGPDGKIPLGRRDSRGSFVRARGTSGVGFGAGGGGRATFGGRPLERGTGATPRNRGGRRVAADSVRRRAGPRRERARETARTAWARRAYYVGAPHECRRVKVAREPYHTVRGGHAAAQNAP